MIAERLTAEHWLDLRRMDQDQGFMGMLGGLRDEAGTAVYLEQNLKHWACYGFGIWILRDEATATVIGRAILRHLNVEGVDEIETGYGFMPAYWGQGLATEIARACVRIGFEQIGLRSIVAITTPINTASQRVMMKAGLAYEREITHAGVPHLLFRTLSRR